MAESWRIVDTGLRPAAQNVALDRALLEARRAEEIPSTLRFYRYASCALIGCGRSPAQELDLEACRSGGFAVQRRLTAGDVMVLDEGQLAWALYLQCRDVGTTDARAIARRLCHAAATAVSALGVDARYRPPRDIEVDGRRISDGAGVFDGDALLFQAALYVDSDPARLARASRLESAACGPARGRIASLEELLGSKADMARLKACLKEAFESEFGIEFGEGDLTLSEHARFRSALGEIDHPDWVNLLSRPAADLPLLHAQSVGAPLRATVAYDRASGVIRQVWFDATVPIAPGRVLADLESVLRDVPADRLVPRIERFFANRPVQMAPIQPADFAAVVQLAIRQLLVNRV